MNSSTMYIIRFICKYIYGIKLKFKASGANDILRLEQKVEILQTIFWIPFIEWKLLCFD